jgi:hypothetical protein
MDTFAHTKKKALVHNSSHWVLFCVATKETRGMPNCGLAIYILKSMLRQKKKNYYGNSNISPCKNILIFKKSFKRKPPFTIYYNSITNNLKVQHKPKYHLSKILI